MKDGAPQYAYGPVPSRRLGKSLGINNIPAKVCTYSCVYCQVGRTTQMKIDRGSFYDPHDIFRDVQSRLRDAEKSGERVDYLAFVPDGEPTVDVNLGKEIDLAKTLKVPVAVITNSSLLWRDDVREELGKADWVSLKVDAVQETLWRQINRPQRSLRLAPIMDGMTAFAKAFPGRLVTETMLIRGINDNDDCLKDIAAFLHTLRPYAAYLSIPTRPPVERWVAAPDEEILNRAYQILADNVRSVEYLTGYEGNAFAVTGNITNDLLSMTAVHPMRKEAVDSLLSRAGASWNLVDRLLAQGEIKETEYNGHVFYLRRFKETGLPAGADKNTTG